MRTLREFRQILKQARDNHVLRHRPSRFGVALFDSIHYAPQDAWNLVVPEKRLFMRHRNPASNAVVKPLFGFVKPTTWTKRHPVRA